MGYELKTADFSLVLDLDIFFNDIQYPENTILKISLDSRGFSAHTTMDIDIKEFSVFVSDIEKLYDTLSGAAEIKEPYGSQSIKFSAGKAGHIYVLGTLSGSDGGYCQSLEFENSFDQTYLKNFVHSLKGKINEIKSYTFRS